LATEENRTNGDFIRISNRDIWIMLQTIRKDVDDMRNDLRSALHDQTDNEKRIRKLELKVYSLLSGVSAGGTLYAIAVARGH